MNDYLMNTYLPMPVSFSHGKGAWLWDEDGTRYLDAVSGLAVCSLGHAHEKVAASIADQASRLIHTGNLVHIPWQQKLAEKLADITGMDKVFFGNSGAEAIECALKIARLYGHSRGIDKPGVIVMDGSFHGRTMAALSATGSRKVQAGFEPLVSGFVRAPFGDAGAVDRIGSRSSDICAVLVEPIQGEAGINIPAQGYLSELREICNRNGWLLILDEIQCGLCRTGRWYAHQHEGIQPDILTTAKALANGLPIGACIARGKAANIFKPGQHGSTFGGNPLVSRAACTVLDVMRDEDIAGQAQRQGQALLDGFRERIGELPQVRDIRGLGLMIGIELDRDVNHLKDQALEQGLLINITRNQVIRLLPPLIIDDAQVAEIVDRVSGLVESLD